MLRRVTGLPIHVVTKDPTELDEIADPLQECVNRTVVDIEVVVNEHIAETRLAAGPVAPQPRDRSYGAMAGSVASSHAAVPAPANAPP